MKRLIICLDGTWNADDGSSPLTNVAKLHSLLAKTDAAGVAQISHYIDGIASERGIRSAFVRGAIGSGVADRIREAYEVLLDSYAPGDEIFLFGFSRGAFEARSLAGFIALVGIGRRTQGFDVDAAWAAYRTIRTKRSPETLAQLRAAAHYPVRIKCIGVWDTVGGIGNPVVSSGLAARKHSYHDVSWNGIADIGLHALSIDEKRGTFRPLLWTLPRGQSLPQGQHVEQVWFSGTHADVGGGWRETALSDIALRWMVERVAATSGLMFDAEKLAAISWPDPLGPQHSSTGSQIFVLSRLIPFIRLVRQNAAAVSPLRRIFTGRWRTGHIPRDQVSINESVHESSSRRFGQKVVELEHSRSHMIEYRPAAIAAEAAPQESPDPSPQDKPRRIKLFTVHGTFAYETTWDDWDTNDDGKRAADTRNFVNRLSDHLREQNITLEAADHAQYNWSGGNSHDERRNAAIGLKKHIQSVLAEDEKTRGSNYYDGVYVVSHSHGGTISRLAMNLWDKPHDYYTPEKTETYDEFKHDDTCQVCKRSRNGVVGPATHSRPNGIITFGSPFVTFEKRKAGLVTARIGTWVYCAFAFAVAALMLKSGYDSGWNIAQSFAAPGIVVTGMRVVWPLLLTWLFAIFLPGIILPAVERHAGKGTTLFAVNAVLQTIKIVTLLLLACYFAAFAYGWWRETGGWNEVVAWLPFVTYGPLQALLVWITLIGVTWATVVTLPKRVLHWIKYKVAPLGEKLPTKYDPAEDRVVKYLSYHTPGDEAGFGLSFFGLLTWLIQTLGLAFACFLGSGLLLLVLIAIDAALQLTLGKGLLSPFGMSPFSSDPSERDRFIMLMNGLTSIPNAIFYQLGLGNFTSLGDLPNSRNASWWIPLAIVLSLFLMFLLLVPVMLILLSVAYVTALWLRRTGLVFGAEGLAWNLANRIAVSRRPNSNTALRIMLLSPEAWWRREVAHCYYYKSEKVIADLARSIANWGQIETSPAVPIGRWISSGARAACVATAMLSIFVTSVPVAGQMATLASYVSAQSTASSEQSNTGACPSEPRAGALPAATKTRQNLKRIRGIDEGVEQKLNALGVTTYEQIANWQCPQISLVSHALKMQGVVERQAWVQQATVLNDGGSTQYSKQVDSEAANSEAALAFRKQGKDWCIDHAVTVRNTSTTSRPSSELGSIASAEWEASVTKKYGAEWAKWPGSFASSCRTNECVVTAQICVPRNLQCADELTEVRYDFELPARLGKSAGDSIKTAVGDDLKRQWDAKLTAQSQGNWVTAQDIDNYFKPFEQVCTDEDDGDGRVRYRCKLAIAACEDLPPAKMPPGSVLQVAK